MHFNDNTTVKGDCLKYFFPRDEAPAHGDTTGSQSVCLKYFFSRMNFLPMTIQQDLKVSVSNIFSRGDTTGLKDVCLKYFFSWMNFLLMTTRQFKATV